MRLYLNNGKNNYNISQIVEKVSMSGDYTQSCRTIEFDITKTNKDWNMPYVETKLGDLVTLTYNNEFIMEGYIWSRENDAEGNTLGIVCRDRGIYLKKNKAVYISRGETPESLTNRICRDFGIETGTIATTGIAVTRFFYGVDLYSIIMTAYSKASEQNGKKYLIRFTGKRLNVIEKGAGTDGVYLRGDQNIIAATYKESLDSTVTRVSIYDKNNNFVKNIDNAELVKAYGIMQEFLRQTDDNTQESAAKKKLEKNGIERKVTVQNLGDPRCITGNIVYILEPVTGLYGKFYIDGDTHTWKNGMYFNRLTLNFVNMMDEKEAGSDKEQNEASSAPGTSSGSSGAQGDGKSTGRFTWPATVKTITSEYGNRLHPIQKTWKMHTGIDIGAGAGTNIFAADGGAVSLAGENGGYGKCIIIDHTGGLQTLYGHCSSLAVSAGSKVTKGQVIGKVGMTGTATGPHLHFEVRKNGTAVNPHNYL